MYTSSLEDYTGEVLRRKSRDRYIKMLPSSEAYRVSFVTWQEIVYEDRISKSKGDFLAETGYRGGDGLNDLDITPSREPRKPVAVCSKPESSLPMFQS
ncbi:uncharacterized protein RAG0_14400 [Rhynchosporium agropyri]|uniref:Uncharacterized protein n=1 Tax=Rhynchosporium agropyri TaxID=914238 RepID=A0A1E1LGS7_9HELO|nr:uncharacterized protein RAG0_14400 [Rhynchosporium agropyri]